MSYDIPPPLQHKEKIIFGLTFSQLAYAFPTLLLIFFIIFKTNLTIYVSGCISLVIAFLAAFFMFFDGLEKVKNWYNYLRNPKINVMSKELMKIVDIKNIEDNIIKQSKSELAILEVIPMNFMLKTDIEKEAVIIGFQKFLNSLDFPIQIHITSTKIDLSSHFDYTSKKVNEKAKECNEKEGVKLKTLVKDYSDFVNNSIIENNIQNRNFYIIIKKKDNLEMQIKVCSEKLISLGLKVKQLNTKEISNFFYSYMASNKQKEMKQEEIKDIAHFIYAPEKVFFDPDYFTVDDKFYKTIAVTGYPQSVEMNFLNKIISSGEKYDISIHIEPFPLETTMIQLNRELQKQQADLYADNKKGIINPSLEIKFSSTRKVLEDLQKGKQKLFNVSLYITCQSKPLSSYKLTEKEIEDIYKNNKILPKEKEENYKKRIKKLIETEELFAKPKREVDLLSKKVKADFDSLMIQSKVPMFQMMESYTSMLPLAKNDLRINRNIHTEGLAAFFPFSSPFLDIEDDGILLGLNKNKIPYIKNVFNLANANGIILATSGSGKSYFTKLLLSRQFMNGTDVIIIDPQGEYLAITQQYTGECITLSKNSETIINPLDLMGHDYMEKRLSLMDLFHIMISDLNELQKSILDKAIDFTYLNSGIKRDDYENHEPPIMSDLLNTLKAFEKKSVNQEKVTYRALINRIQMYTENGVFGFLDKQTKINFNNKFVCFNIGSMPKQVKAVIMYLVLDYVFMCMKNNNRRKLLVIDEAWSLLQTAEESSYIFEIVKTCRKYNLGLLMITQDVADLVASKAGHAVLANTSYTFLLRQKPAVINNVSSTFNLSQTEKEFLMSAKLGTGILILENEHQELEVIASPEEHKFITTNPDEMIKISEAHKPKESETKKESEKADLDLTKLIFLNKGLTNVQENVLGNQGYVLKKGHGLDSGSHSYFIKERTPESPEHTLLVGLIVEELKKHTDKIELYQTKNPDIIFENKVGQKIALEIETGIEFSKHIERLKEKFIENKKTFGDRCYIVLNDKKIKNRYFRFNIPLLYRADIIKFVTLQFSGKMNTYIGGVFKVASSEK